MKIDDKPADEDSMVQTCILINEINIRFSGMNQPNTDVQVDEESIDQLQRICHNLWEAMIQILNLSIETKLHRLMWKIKTQFTDFGSLI